LAFARWLVAARNRAAALDRAEHDADVQHRVDERTPVDHDHEHDDGDRRAAAHGATRVTGDSMAHGAVSSAAGAAATLSRAV
jgi:hypothetical protein